MYDIQMVLGRNYLGFVLRLLMVLTEAKTLSIAASSSFENAVNASGRSRILRRSAIGTRSVNSSYAPKAMAAGA